MKKYLVGLLLLVSSLFAASGEDVYMQYCASCHTKDMKMDSKNEWRKNMQDATKEEKITMRQRMMNGRQDTNMRAPTMPMISMRLKHMMDSKEKFITFVEEYIQDPSQEKGYCMPMAYKRFGVMPAIGKGMSVEERKLVSQWLYENFDGSWNNSKGGVTCQNKNMKCGGQRNNNMKCGSN